MSATTKHTPGPWTRANDTYARNRTRGSEHVRYNGLIVAIRGPEANDADMDLIAAAPDLLEALRVCATELHDAKRWNSDAYEMACAAIAKAQGGAL